MVLESWIACCHDLKTICKSLHIALHIFTLLVLSCIWIATKKIARIQAGHSGHVDLLEFQPRRTWWDEGLLHQTPHFLDLNQPSETGFPTFLLIHCSPILPKHFGLRCNSAFHHCPSQNIGMQKNIFPAISSNSSISGPFVQSFFQRGLEGQLELVLCAKHCTSSRRIGKFPPLLGFHNELKIPAVEWLQKHNPQPSPNVLHATATPSTWEHMRMHPPSDLNCSKFSRQTAKIHHLNDFDHFLRGWWRWRLALGVTRKQEMLRIQSLAAPSPGGLPRPPALCP